MKRRPGSRPENYEGDRDLTMQVGSKAGELMLCKKRIGVGHRLDDVNKRGPRETIGDLREGIRRCLDDELDTGTYRIARAPTLSQMDGFDPFDD